MLSKHADEPICSECGEDRLSMIDRDEDRRGIQCSCKVCAHSWWIWKAEPLIDVSGNLMTEP